MPDSPGIPDGPEDLPPDPFPGDPFADHGTGASGTPDQGSDANALAALFASLGAPGGTGAGLDPSALLRALGGGGGGLAWDMTRQLALWTATGDSGVEANVEPLERIALEDLVARVVPVVADVTGLEPGHLRAESLTRAGWAAQFLEDHRALLDRMARAASIAPEPDSLAAGDELGDVIGQLGPMLAMLGPTLMSQMLGSQVGQCARWTLGTYDFALGRRSHTLTLVPTTIRAFADEWSIPYDVAATQTAVSDVVLASLLAVAHVGERLRDLVGVHADATRLDVSGLGEQMGSILAAGTSAGATPGQLGQLQLFGASSAQLAIRSEIATLLTPLLGFAEYATNIAGARLLGDNRKVAEAWRRRRAEPPSVVHQLAALFGVEVRAPLIERGAGFIGGLLQRGASAVLGELWTEPSHLPTRSELDAPGLWLARLSLD